MEILRKLKKLGSFHLRQDDNPPPPLPTRPANFRQLVRDETAPADMDYGPLPRSFFSAVNSAREQAGYDPISNFPRGPIPSGEENPMYESSESGFPGFDRSRSKSRERIQDRSTRPRSRGTPVKFRRRPISPELFQPRTSSPFVFRQHSLPNSPGIQRHFQHAPQFQQIPRQQQQQQQQFDMRMAHPAQFFPQFQQPFYPMMNPHVNMDPWFMMRQPQMYPFF